MKTFLGKQYEAHNALADVRALQELFEDYCRCVAGLISLHSSIMSLNLPLNHLLRQKLFQLSHNFFFIENSLSLLRLNNFCKRYPDNGIRNVFSKPLSRKFVQAKDFLVYKCPHISQRLPK